MRGGAFFNGKEGRDDFRKTAQQGGYIPNPYGRDLGLGYRTYDLLDDIDFYYNKVKCRKIEKLLPVLGKLVIEEQKLLQNQLYG